MNFVKIQYIYTIVRKIIVFKKLDIFIKDILIKLYIMEDVRLK